MGKIQILIFELLHHTAWLGNINTSEKFTFSIFRAEMDILQESLGGGSTHKTHNMVENVCIK
jgi:hypothetical protein